MLLQILGLLFVLVIPGLLLTQILFKEAELPEKILLVFLLSIAFSVALGLFLGFNELMKNITGGLKNVWVYSVVINAALALLYFSKTTGSKLGHKKTKHKR